MTYNIRRGGVGREDALAAVVNACRPDLVLLQEATRPSVVERVAARTGMAQSGAAGRQSLGFMSREPLEHFAWHRPRLSRHAFLEAVPRGGFPRVFGVHLSAVHAAWTEARRELELRALLRSIKQHQGGFHLLAGDFNTLAPGEVLDFARLPARLRALVWLSGGKVRWRTIRIVLDQGYLDAFRVKHEEPGPTFPTWDPHVRLDYVFVPAAYRERLACCHVVHAPDAPAASDHFPIVAEFRID
jgi:exodeoxyribonuclease-3